MAIIAIISVTSVIFYYKPDIISSNNDWTMPAHLIGLATRFSTGAGGWAVTHNVATYQAVKDKMLQYNLNIIRISSSDLVVNGVNQFSANFPWLDGVAIEWFLNNTDFIVIICRHHTVGAGNTVDITQTMWEVIDSNLDVMATRWESYGERVWYEPINEYSDALYNDFYSRMQHIIDVFRVKHNQYLVFNKNAQDWETLSDPLDKTFQGAHHYFDPATSASYGDTIYNVERNRASATGDPIIDTEIGADVSENSQFTKVEVDAVNRYLQLSYDNGIGNLMWMGNGLWNMPKYESLGLSFPPDDNTILTSDKWFGVENTGDPSQWTTILSRTNSQGWNFTVHRIAFNWDDANLYSNIESCLTLIDSYGIKVVLDAHYVSGHQLVKFGSEQWFTNWETMVTYFKNDKRVIAWEIFNEAFPQYADSSIGGDGTGTNTVLHVEALMKAQYDCSVRIRVIDPIRPIIWFPHYLSEENETTRRWTPLSSPYGVNYVSKISNIILTWHMYSYGSKSTLVDLQSQLNYKLPQIVDLSKAYPVWLGETAWHEASAGGASNPVIEAQYVALILKAGREHGWGFNYWAYRINHYAPVSTYPETSADVIIRASGYVS